MPSTNLLARLNSFVRRHEQCHESFLAVLSNQVSEFNVSIILSCWVIFINLTLQLPSYRLVMQRNKALWDHSLNIPPSVGRQSLRFNKRVVSSVYTSKAIVDWTSCFSLRALVQYKLSEILAALSQAWPLCHRHNKSRTFLALCTKRW